MTERVNSRERKKREIERRNGTGVGWVTGWWRTGVPGRGEGSERVARRNEGFGFVPMDLHNRSSVCAHSIS